MCGLTGLVGPTSVGDQMERVRVAAASLTHRGPDGTGFLSQGAGGAPALLTLGGHVRELAPVAGPAGCAVALGHRRLSIIDLTDAGAQPFVSGDEHSVLMLNGEIYNYLELRSELQALGVRFRSASDTEVLLKAWEQWGSDCLSRLTGMFAFALLDRGMGTLTLVRDAFGMKPMFYAVANGEFSFASEIGTLLALAGTSPCASPAQLGRFLFSGVTDDASETLFEGIHSLPAAHLLRLSLSAPGAPVTARWWAPDLRVVDHRSRSVLTDDLRERILTNVRLHLRSDVPVATMLSGGLDSSTIVSAVRRIAGPGADLRTFSYIPESGAFSEQPWIDEVNAATGARSVIVRPSHREWEASLDHLVAAQGEPFGTPAVFVQSQLFAAAASAGVRVLLDGQGGDELFGGYGFARVARMAGHLRRAELRSAFRLNRGVAREGRGGWRQSPLRGALGIFGAAQIRTMRRWGGAPPMGGAANDLWFRDRGVVPEVVWSPRGSRILQERLWHWTEHASLPALLRYADRSAMSLSVESRLPFLTPGLAEFAFSLPDHLLVDDRGIGKRIVRDAMRGIVPDVVLDRRDKVGFAVPAQEWLHRSTRAHQLLTCAAELPCVDARSAQRLALTLRAGHRVRPAETFIAWRLVGLAAWANAFGVRFS